SLADRRLHRRHCPKTLTKRQESLRFGRPVASPRRGDAGSFILTDSSLFQTTPRVLDEGGLPIGQKASSHDPESRLHGKGNLAAVPELDRRLVHRGVPIGSWPRAVLP